VIPYDEMDPGIRDAVVFLAAHGFHPTDSGDGVSKTPGPDVLPFPHVFSVLDNADGMVALAQRAWRLPWADAGLVRPSIELSWQAPDGVAILVCTWEP
jgi:hypothetical protein